MKYMRIFLITGLLLLLSFCFGTSSPVLGTEKWEIAKEKAEAEHKAHRENSQRCFYESGCTHLSLEYQECIAKAQGPEAYERFMKKQREFADIIEKINKMR